MLPSQRLFPTNPNGHHGLMHTSKDKLRGHCPRARATASPPVPSFAPHRRLASASSPRCSMLLSCRRGLSTCALKLRVSHKHFCLEACSFMPGAPDDVTIRGPSARVPASMEQTKANLCDWSQPVALTKRGALSVPAKHPVFAKERASPTTTIVQAHVGCQLCQPRSPARQAVRRLGPLAPGWRPGALGRAGFKIVRRSCLSPSSSILFSFSSSHLLLRLHRCRRAGAAPAGEGRDRVCAHNHMLPPPCPNPGADANDGITQAGVKGSCGRAPSALLLAPSALLPKPARRTPRSAGGKGGSCMP